MTNTPQLSVPEVADQERYLGNAHVVHKFMADFAMAVMGAYAQYLSGVESGPVVMGKINQIVAQWNDGFMRGGDYQIAPWQGAKLRRTVMAVLEDYDGTKECGLAFFEFYALQCVKASLSLSDGLDDQEVREHLREILLDGEQTLLGLNYP